MSKLIYIGNGGAIIGVPARDLTEDEVKQLAQEFDVDNLIKSGLYKTEEQPAPKKIKAGSADKSPIQESRDS